MKKILSLLFLVSLFTNLHAQTTTLDFETDGSTVHFGYFGSSLDGSLTASIANPNATGINTSATVEEYIRAANSEVWAGAFANPAPTIGIDASNGGQVCVKVHFDHIGNLALKLEQPSGGEDWITMQPNTAVGEWEELCFDLSANSIEDSNLPAAGRTFGQMVLFFDFQEASTVSDVTFYFDDITYPSIETTGGGGEMTTGSTFSVDMTGYNETFTQVYLSGSMNSWSGDANPLSDEDGDGIWTITLPLDDATYEYKFSLDNWNAQEIFTPGDECTLTTDEFTNRIIEISGDKEVCFQWNSCAMCGEETSTGGGGNNGGGMDMGACTTIFDFESDATSTAFQYFGSDLDGETTIVIGNPNPSGINTSGSVAEYIKAANSEVWAGAFSNPAPASPIDAINGGQICIKVHMDHIGNLAVKLEASTSGGEDWITTVANTQVNEWEELCFDLSAPSLEGSNLTATGHIYAQMVIFFDFESNSENEVIYYFDDVVFCGVAGETQAQEVTYTVDMNGYEGDFTQVYLSGSMNGWSGNANPLSDEDGDGIWTTTLPLTNGVYEYKFTLDDYTVQEQFNGSETCTKLTVDGGTGERFVNRLYTVTADNTNPGVVCFNSCYACGESAIITYNLNMSSVGAAESGVFVAGGNDFGASKEEYRLTDPDGDGVYSISIERPIGYSTFYTFTNGNCPDYSCKENIAGQDCANTDNFNDRFLDALAGDVVINTCFAECTTDLNCAGPAAGGDVTFEVDMNSYEGEIGTVYVSGSMNGWSGDANPLSDEDSDGIWTGVVTVPGGIYEYKFTIDNWAAQEEFAGGESCTITAGGITNRSIRIDGDASVCFAFNTCNSCTVGLNNLIVNDALFSIQPTLVQDYALISFENTREKRYLQVLDQVGKTLVSTTLEGTIDNYELNTANLDAGLYIVTVQTATMIATKKIVKQ